MTRLRIADILPAMRTLLALAMVTAVCLPAAGCSGTPDDWSGSRTGPPPVRDRAATADRAGDDGRAPAEDRDDPFTDDDRIRAASGTDEDDDPAAAERARRLLAAREMELEDDRTGPEAADPDAADPDAAGPDADDPDAGDRAEGGRNTAALRLELLKLEGDDPLLRVEAARNLGAMGDPRAVPGLVDALAATDGRVAVQSAVVDALTALTGRDHGDLHGDPGEERVAEVVTAWLRWWRDHRADWEGPGGN